MVVEALTAERPLDRPDSDYLLEWKKYGGGTIWTVDLELYRYDTPIGTSSITSSVDFTYLDNTMPVHEHFIDINKIRQWIFNCDDDHTCYCHSPEDPWARVDPAPEIILIDVKRKCLVRVRGFIRYVALSYVWGQPITGVEPFQTTLHNYNRLSRDGAFSLTENFSYLPNVIKDSITLTERLGLRYLWCDRFCIVQDDPTTKPMSLHLMANMYSNSYLTIAACEGRDGNVGLLGISSDRPRKKPFYQFNSGPNSRYITFDSTPPHGIESRYYHTRGWTFQEWFFSQRLLIFHNDTVSFQCRSAIWTEIGMYPRSPAMAKHIAFQHREALLSRWPNFRLYSEFVSEYMRRILTYLEDVYNAFSAL